MSSFFSSMFEEMGARRRRLRTAFGDRGQALTEFMVLSGLAIGSLGLFIREWMPDAAPWGFWLPLVFVVGYFLIEARRQAALAKIEGEEALAKLVRTYDWTVFLWAFGCALAGAAAFVIAYSAEPVLEDWTPPESAVAVEVGPQ